MFKLKNKITLLLAFGIALCSGSKMVLAGPIKSEQTQFNAVAQEMATYAKDIKESLVEIIEKLTVYESFWKHAEKHVWTHHLSKDPRQWFTKFDNSTVIKKHIDDLGSAIKRAFITLGTVQQAMEGPTAEAQKAQQICSLAADYYADSKLAITATTAEALEQHLKKATAALKTHTKQVTLALQTAHKPAPHIERHMVAYAAGTVAALAAAGVLIANRDAIKNNTAYAFGGIKHFLKLHVVDPLTEIKQMYWDHKQASRVGSSNNSTQAQQSGQNQSIRSNQAITQMQGGVQHQNNRQILSNSSPQVSREEAHAMHVAVHGQSSGSTASTSLQVPDNSDSSSDIDDDSAYFDAHDTMPSPSTALDAASQSTNTNNAHNNTANDLIQPQTIQPAQHNDGQDWLNVEKELIPADLCTQAINDVTNALCELDRQIAQEKAALRPILKEYLKNNTNNNCYYQSLLDEQLLTPKEFNDYSVQRANPAAESWIIDRYKSLIRDRRRQVENADLDTLINKMIEHNDATQFVNIFSNRLTAPVTSFLLGGQLITDFVIQGLIYKLKGLKSARYVVEKTSNLGLQLATRKIRDINNVYRDNINLINKYAKNFRIFGAAAQMIPAVFVGSILGSAGAAVSAASIGGYYLWKKAHRKQYLVDIKTLLRSIDQYLNTLNNPKAFCTTEQYGIMIFQVHKLRKPAQLLNYEQRKLFLEDLAELESTGTTVAQKIGTLTRMYRTHTFLSA